MNPLFCYLDEDLCELYLLFKHCSKNAKRKQQYFTLDEFTSYECYQNFRFLKGDLLRLCRALQLPAKVVTPSGTMASGLEALCIVLRRLAYPNRLSDICDIFHRAPSEISALFNSAIDLLHAQHNHRLTRLNHPWMQQQDLTRMAQAIHNKGVPLPNCVGFIDGTVRPMTKPGRYQREVFNGHKRQHALKFQAVMMPNGIISHLFGPIEGRRHDVILLHESGLMQLMRNHFVDNAGNPFYLYGDQAYPIDAHLISPFRGANLQPEEAAFNASMSTVRSSVEWGFGKIVSLFAYLDFKKGLKLWQQPVGKYYIVGALLTNCHTCLYGSETTKNFGIDPPALEAYLY